jgi:hypothetical protein
MSSDIWVGDLARALRALGPLDPEQRAAVAGMLGLMAGPVADRGTALPDDTETGASAQPEPEGSGPRDLLNPPESDRPPPLQAVLNKDLPLLPPLGPAPVSRPQIWRGPPLARVEPRHLSPRIPLAPLLAPSSADVILRTVIARWVPGGPVDTDALVRTVARQQVVRVIPRTPAATLRFGAQILVDLGRGMEPFVSDRRAVLRQLRRVAGEQNLTVQYFRNAPLRGVASRPNDRLTGYQPPAPGTRILLLSDLGLGGSPGDYRRGTREEWEALAGLAARSDCQLTALVPCPSRRWPAWLVKLFPLISWDRRTTAAEAAHQMGRR